MSTDMKITSNRPKEVTIAEDDPRCITIKSNYGTANTMLSTVMAQKPKAGTPELVLMIKTYGPDVLVSQIAGRLRVAMLRLDESMLNDEEIMSIATSIIKDEDALVLGYDLVMDFFKRLELCEYELYSGKPRHIMAAWKSHCAYAKAMQTRLNEAAESEARRQEQAKHEREYLRPAEFRKWKESFLNKPLE